jgi:signal transduction histidine kinase
MTPNLTILIAGSLANVFLALIVYIKNPRQFINRTFAVLVFSLVGLAIATYASLHTSSPLPYIRLTMIFALILVTAFKWFSLWFPDAHGRLTTVRLYELGAACFVALVMLSPFTFSSVHIASNGNVQPTFRPGIAAFFVYFIYMVGSGLWILIQRLRKAQSKQRSQLIYMISATIFLFGAEFISSLIVPIVFKVSVGVAYSSLYFAVFAAIVTVAIVKRQLFDIRAVVARSVTYLLLFTTLVGLYAAALFILSALFFSVDKVSRLYQMVNIILAILLAFTFPYLKRFFDHLTQRIFYRQAYDTQTVLKQLTEMLVSKVSLSAIMQQSLKILSGSIEISKATFIVMDEGKTYRIKSHGDTLKELPDVAALQNIHTDLLVTGDITNNALKAALAERDIEVVVRLRTPDVVIGFLLAGLKSSGTIYTVQDLELLQIASKTLAVAVQNALFYEKIQNFNLTLQQKVQNATKELRHTNDKLRALDETKDDFISMASHQLRTPLTSVKGYLSLVLEGDAGGISEQQRKLLNQAFISSQRMVYLISDLLNVSRLKTGKFIIEATPVNLADVISDEIAQLVETARSRSIELKYEKPKDFPTLMLDETKTRQVIMNFVDNAIYYTPENGHIEVELIDKPATVELRVVDDGIGVPKSEQHHLFTKFYRAQNARRARPDGTGLGLFMAKKVIAGQGGAIIFESTEGKGSTFGFTFSKAKLAIKPPSAPATSETTIAK